MLTLPTCRKERDKNSDDYDVRRNIQQTCNGVHVSRHRSHKCYSAKLLEGWRIHMLHKSSTLNSKKIDIIIALSLTDIVLIKISRIILTRLKWILPWLRMVKLWTACSCRLAIVPKSCQSNWSGGKVQLRCVCNMHKELKKLDIISRNYRDFLGSSNTVNVVTKRQFESELTGLVNSRHYNGGFIDISCWHHKNNEKKCSNIRDLTRK